MYPAIKRVPPPGFKSTESILNSFIVRLNKILLAHCRQRLTMQKIPEDNYYTSPLDETHEAEDGAATRSAAEKSGKTLLLEFEHEYLPDLTSVQFKVNMDSSNNIKMQCRLSTFSI